MPLFVPGTIVATRAALAVLDRFNEAPQTLLNRHCSGDWGELSQADVEANANALAWGGRLLSKYTLRGESFYVITEHDRSYTTLMLTQDY